MVGWALKANYLSICLPIILGVKTQLFIYLSTYYLSAYLSVRLSLYLSGMYIGTQGGNKRTMCILACLHDVQT